MQNSTEYMDNLERKLNKLADTIGLDRLVTDLFTSENNFSAHLEAIDFGDTLDARNKSYVRTLFKVLANKDFETIHTKMASSRAYKVDILNIVTRLVGRWLDYRVATGKMPSNALLNIISYRVKTLEYNLNISNSKLPRHLQVFKLLLDMQQDLRTSAERLHSGSSYYQLKQFREKGYKIITSTATKKKLRGCIREALYKGRLRHTFKRKEFTPSRLRTFVVDEVYKRFMDFFHEGGTLSLPTWTQQKVFITVDGVEKKLTDHLVDEGVYYLEEYKLSSNPFLTKSLRPGLAVLEPLTELLERQIRSYAVPKKTVPGTNRTTDAVGKITEKYLSYPYLSYTDYTNREANLPNRVSPYGRNLIGITNITLRNILYSRKVAEIDIKRAGQTIIANLYVDMLGLKGSEAKNFIYEFRLLNKRLARKIISTQPSDHIVLSEIDAVPMEESFKLNLITIFNTRKAVYLEAVYKFLDSRTPASSPHYISNGVVEYPRALFSSWSKGRIMSFIEQGLATVIIYNDKMLGQAYDACYIPADQTEVVKEIILNNATNLNIDGLDLHTKYRQRGYVWQ